MSLVEFDPFMGRHYMFVVFDCLLVSLSLTSWFRKRSKLCNSLKGEVLLFCCAAESRAQLVSASWAAVSFFLPKLCDWMLNLWVLHIQRLSDGVPLVIQTTRVQRWKWPGFCYQSNDTMRGWNLVFSTTLKGFFLGGGYSTEAGMSPLKCPYFTNTSACLFAEV